MIGGQNFEGFWWQTVRQTDICYSIVTFATENINNIDNNNVSARDGDIYGANDHSARWPARSRRVQVGSEKIQKMMM